MTATAILMLIEQGLLNYDDDIKKFFPRLPYKNVTVRHLLNHTSGIPDYINSEYLFRRYVKDRKSYMSNDELINILSKYHIKAHFESGTHHRYSNTGYALLASIVEKVTNTPFADFMKNQLFEKAEMYNTYCFTKSLNESLIRKDYRETILGAKGVFSTVEDMLKFDQALYKGKLLKYSTLDSAYAKGSTTDSTSFDYGLGWRIRQNEHGERLIYHKGLWEDANPMFIRFVDCNRTIISLNHPLRRSNSWDIIHTIAQIMNESEAVCSSF
jgi:CubicO group peptidase (beta-lactamase class C family)